jgi:hypothetical protein
MFRILIAVCLAVLVASSATGHEGHGIPGQENTVSHDALDPLHLPIHAM